jgi:hypothetical protein
VQSKSSALSEEMRAVLEIESDADIEEMVNDPLKMKLITPRLVSPRSYLSLFKVTSRTKLISVQAFNMLTGVCEHQVQLNLLGEESLVRVVYDRMVVPISIVMKLTHQEEEMGAVTLKSKYLAVEEECLSSLTESRKMQKHLLSALQRLLITPPSHGTGTGGAITTSSGSSSSGSSRGVEGHSHEETLALAMLQDRLVEAETEKEFLKEQLQDARKKVRTLQGVVKEANELSFSLRSLTSPRTTASESTPTGVSSSSGLPHEETKTGK